MLTLLTWHPWHYCICYSTDTADIASEVSTINTVDTIDTTDTVDTIDTFRDDTTDNLRLRQVKCCETSNNTQGNNRVCNPSILLAKRKRPAGRKTRAIGSENWS